MAIATVPRTTRRAGKLDWNDFVHTGPGTAAGIYLRSFWQPIARSEDLPAGRAKPVRIMSEDFTLYRGENGAPHVLAFRCAHRGTQLSTGWVEGDNLRCFYHGWMYDGTGQCVEQPAEPEPFCQKIRIRSYPAEDYLGLVFVYLGEGDPPPLPRYEDYERVETWADVYVRDCNYFQHMDNQFDHAHVPFVHGGRSGVEIPISTTDETDWGLVDRREYPTRPPTVDHWGMPNIFEHRRPETDGRGDVIRWQVPIDDERHYNFSVFVGEPRRAGGYAEAGQRAAELTARILAGETDLATVERTENRSTITIVQDSIAQIGQGIIVDHAEEHLGRTDYGLVLRRKIWTRELRALAEGQPLKEWIRPEAFYRPDYLARQGGKS